MEAHMPTIEISEMTFDRLKQIAIPLKSDEQWTTDAALNLIMGPSVAPESDAPKKIGAFIEDLLIQTNRDGFGFSYQTIFNRVLLAFPDCRTKFDNIAWYASKLRQKGKILPERMINVNMKYKGH